ncbi:PaaI family thioesterase [Ferrovibrio sp.]|uniref:PaaI family thioesterase n=1 Tax=Ferrovibrio sp. TaxID=1917215 RepID=UPI0035B2DEFF
MTDGSRIPFRRDAADRALSLSLFNRRAEILWFGFDGSFGTDEAVIGLTALPEGMLGGGGAAALNGGVIAAGFDAAVVLAGLGHYDTDTVVTLNLAVQFLHLARPAPSLAFRAWATRTTRHVCFVEGRLGDGDTVFASCTGMVMPVYAG